MKTLIALTVVAVTTGCLGDVEVPPDPPTLGPVQSPTTIPIQTLSGSKTAGTAVLNDGEVVVPHDGEESWTWEVTLQPGDNVFTLTAQRESGLESRDKTETTIVYEPPCPSPPSLEPVPARTRDRLVALSGTKPMRTSLHLNDQEIVAISDATEWAYALQLPDQDGEHVFDLVARDAKGQNSDPVRFTIVLDRSPPAIVGRYPPVSGRAIPTNASVLATFDGEIAVTGVMPPEGLMVVTKNGQPQEGILTYSVLSRTVTWSSMVDLETLSEYEVTVDPAFVEDLAGNRAPPAGWSWTFTTTTGPDLTPPAAPTVSAPAVVMTPEVSLEGTKEPLSSIYVNGRQAVPLDGSDSWRFDLPLPIGTTSVAIAARSVADIETALEPISVTREVDKPDPPMLDPSVPTEVTEPRVNLVGTRPADTSVLLDGNVVACRGPDPSWSFQAPLNPGVNDLKLTTRSANGVESDPLIHTVDFTQQYEGPVPNGFVLQVQLTLRDLSQIPEIRSEFVTGANNYGIDAWVEGPIEPGETCQMGPNRTRQNIKYVATIQNYIGTKAQHKVPFADEDYRGADYLGALISGGVFSFLGLGPESQRRDDAGKELPGLLAGLTEPDLRQNIDCFGSPVVDLCTHATANDGPYDLEPWTPRRRGGQGLLEQGDYLLWIQLNLDRGGSWLSANDVETCWGVPADRDKGMHRFVQRISLGSSPYELTIPQAEELSGPDREGAEKLYFVSDEGVLVRWGPMP